MAKINKTSNKVVVRKEKRQLVLHSNVIKKFPEVKEVLRNHEKIKIKDIEQFPQELKSFFKHGQFDELVEIAQSEWVASASYKEVEVDSRESKVKCALCNTPNVYIYYIKNKHNEIELNVGSDCISKFPGIEGFNKFNLEKNKKERQKKLKQIERMRTLNERYPNIKNVIVEHRRYYNVRRHFAFGMNNTLFSAK